MASPPLGDSTRDDRRLALAELVLEIATAAAGTVDLDAILRAALDRLGTVIPFTGGSIALVDGDDLVIHAAAGPFVDEAIGQRLPRGAGRSWRIVESRVPERVDDLAASGVRAAGPHARAAMRSWLGVPILRAGRGIGLLEVDSTRPAAFTEADAELLRTVAAALAGPIDLAARHALERQQRELRDAFTGVVSHELRTPITTIYGMSQVLSQRHARLDPDARASLIADIETEADRLRRLVEDLLILSRVEGGNLQLDLEPVVLGHVVRRVVDAEAARWPDHRFAVWLQPDLPVVLADPLSVEQVLRNLLSNAAKYSPGGGTIEVQAQAGDGVVEVVVLDPGIGLPDGDPERLFELYVRATEASRHAPGAGIGLFVCRHLVAAMGGRIRAAPRPGGGSAFTFTLPVDPHGTSGPGVA